MLRRYPITGRGNFLDFEGKAYRLKCPRSVVLRVSVAFPQNWDHRQQLQFKDTIPVLSDAVNPQGTLHPFFNPIKGPQNVSKLKLDGMENNFDERSSDGKKQTQANASLCATMFTPIPIRSRLHV